MAQNLVQDLHYPVDIVQMIKDMQQQAAPKENFNNSFISQPRHMSDGTWDVVATTFNNAVSLSEISLNLLQISSEYQLYYIDRNKKRQPVLDRSLHHYKGVMQAGQPDSWFNISRKIYPIVATGLEIWVRRIDDGSGRTVSLGIKDVLYKRNIYNANDAVTPLEDSVDSMGNLVTKYTKSWSSKNAIDGDSFTYWKSEPQPSHDAVVNFYMDIRGAGIPKITRRNLIKNPLFSGVGTWTITGGASTTSNGVLSTVQPVKVTSENTTITVPSGSTIHGSITIDPKGFLAAGTVDVISGGSVVASKPFSGTSSMTVDISTTIETQASYVALSANFTTATSTVDISKPLLELDSTGPFFSGNDIDTLENDYSWEGATNASISRLTYTDQNAGQRVDRFWINPIYSGQRMNLYYSNDESRTTHKLSTNKLTPFNSLNATWKRDIGLTLKDSTSDYSISGKELGYQRWESFCGFIGWKPNFDQAAGTGTNLDLVLLQYSLFSVKYSQTRKEIDIVYGTDKVSIPVQFSAGSEVIVGFGVNYDNLDSDVPIGITVMIPKIDSIDVRSTALRDKWMSEEWRMHDNFKPSDSFSLKNAEGAISYVAFKDQFSSLADIRQGLLNPSAFVVPDINPYDETSTTDNMLYAADFTLQEEGFGGLSDTMFTNKIWTPVWENWTVERKFYFLPTSINAKYLKFEFTDLLEQPYPIWESGIEVKYQTFPIKITKEDINYKTTTDITRTESSYTQSSTRGVLNNFGASVTTSNTVISNAAQDITIDVGSGQLSSTLPNNLIDPPSTSIKVETASSQTFTSTTSTSVIQQASDAYYTVVSGDWLIKIAARYNIPWRDIYNANKAMIDSDPRVKRLPKRSEGWWIFPGQQLRIPGAIMEQITRTQINTEKVVKTTTTTYTTQRFGTTEVHKYDMKTAVRDAAMAYFAGFSDIQVFRLDYLSNNDTESYEWEYIDQLTWSTAGVYETPSRALMARVSGTITSPTLPSMSTFQKLKVNAVCQKPVKSVTTGDELVAVGVEDASVSAWDSQIATWNDPAVKWGSAQPLSTVSLDRSRTFEGRTATRLIKEASPGTVSEAGVQSKTVKIDSRMNGRFSVALFKTRPTSNSIRIEVINKASGNVIFEEELTIELGYWWYSATDWQKFATQDVVVNIIVSGTEQEELWIADLAYEQTAVNFFGSNDGGVNYYDITQAVLNEQYFMFPTADNKLRLRVELWTPKSYIQSIVAEPLYLQ